VMGEREEVAARLHFLINLDSFLGMKTALRWIFFIPAGLIAGSLVSSLFQLFVWIGSWWWGGQDGAWLVFVKCYTLTYFRIICMAWVAPPALKVSTFKIIASLGFGLHFVVALMGAINLSNGSPHPLTEEIVPRWEPVVEIISIVLGYLTAILWDRKSIPLLLADTEGVHPLNALSHDD